MGLEEGGGGWWGAKWGRRVEGGGGRVRGGWEGRCGLVFGRRGVGRGGCRRVGHEGAVACGLEERGCGGGDFVCVFFSRRVWLWGFISVEGVQRCSCPICLFGFGGGCLGGCVGFRGGGGIQRVMSDLRLKLTLSNCIQYTHINTHTHTPTYT